MINICHPLCLGQGISEREQRDPAALKGSCWGAAALVSQHAPGCSGTAWHWPGCRCPYRAIYVLRRQGDLPEKYLFQLFSGKLYSLVLHVKKKHSVPCQICSSKLTQCRMPPQLSYFSRRRGEGRILLAWSIFSTNRIATPYCSSLHRCFWALRLSVCVKNLMKTAEPPRQRLSRAALQQRAAEPQQPPRRQRRWHGAGQPGHGWYCPDT